jgi:hypothetical protein
MIPGQWLYYHVDLKLSTDTEDGHLRVRVYDGNTGVLLAGTGGDVAGELTIPAGTGLQDSFTVNEDMSIIVGSGPFYTSGANPTITIDELAVWDGSLTEAEVDLIVATMVAGVEIPTPALPVPGDADGDGDVDTDDFTIMSANMYTAVAGGASDGDFDNSGTVDFDDFVIQALNFGDWPAAEENNPQQIPEPAAITLITIAACATARRRKGW